MSEVSVKRFSVLDKNIIKPSESSVAYVNGIDKFYENWEARAYQN